MVGVVTEIGLLVLLCVEEVLKPKPRLALTLSHDMEGWTVLARILRLRTVIHIRAMVRAIVAYKVISLYSKLNSLFLSKLYF